MDLVCLRRRHGFNFYEMQTWVWFAQEGDVGLISMRGRCGFGLHERQTWVDKGIVNR